MTNVIQIKESIQQQLEEPKFEFLNSGQNHRINYKIQQFNKLYQELTGESKNLYNSLSARILKNVNVELLDKFSSLKLKIANRKLYVLYEDLLGCNPKSDHLEPKNILPLFVQFFDETEESLRKSLFYVCMTSFQDFILDTLLNETSQRQEIQQKLSAERLQNAMNSNDYQELQKQLNDEIQKLANLKRGIAMQRIEMVEQEFQIKSKDIYEPDGPFSRKIQKQLGLDDVLLSFMDGARNQQNQLVKGFEQLQDDISQLNGDIRQLIDETSLDQLLKAKQIHYKDIQDLTKILNYQQHQLDKLQDGDYDILLKKYRDLLKKYDEDIATKNAQLKSQQDLLQKLQLGGAGRFSSYEDYLAAGMRDNEKAVQAGQFGVVDNNLDFLSMEQLSKMSRDQLIAYASRLQKEMTAMNKNLVRLQQQCTMYSQKMAGIFLVNHFYKNQLYDLLRKINHEFGQGGQLALPLTRFFNAKNIFMKDVIQSSITDGVGVVNDQLNELLIDNMDLGMLQSRREDDSRVIGADEQLQNILKSVTKDVVRQDAEMLLPKAGQYYGEQYLDELANILHQLQGNTARGYGDRLKKLTQLRDEAITLGKLDKGIQVNAYDVLTEFSEAGLTYQDVMQQARAKAQDDIAEYAKQLRSIESSTLTQSQLRTTFTKDNRYNRNQGQSKGIMESYLKSSDLEMERGNKLKKLLDAAEKLSEEARIIAGQKVDRDSNNQMNEMQRKLEILNRAYDTPTMTVTYFEDDLLAEIKTICIQFFDNLEGMPQIIIDNELLKQRESLSKSVGGSTSGRPSTRQRGQIKSSLGPRYGSDCYKITSGRPGSSQSILQPRSKGGLVVNVTKTNIAFPK